jgi:DNA-binding beta-propeller fold protein YncE
VTAASLTVFITLSAPLCAQRPDSDNRLRALLRAVPPLPVERVDVVLPPSLRLDGISAVTADLQGHLYVIHRPAQGDPIVVLDAQGHFLRSWGKGMFATPHGIRIDPAGDVWTIDAHTSVVYKFTPDGKKLLEISVGNIPDKSEEFCGATDIAFGRTGHVFVADGYCNARVIEYDAAGRKLREWGKHGTGPGEFNTVHSIVMGPDGHLYVADRENGRLQWFDQRGKFLGQWKYGGQFYAVAFGPTGEFYAATHPKGVPLDDEFTVVKIDLANGELLGKFDVRAHELAVMPDGTLLPATRGTQLVLLTPHRRN